MGILARYFMRLLRVPPIHLTTTCSLTMRFQYFTHTITSFNLPKSTAAMTTRALKTKSAVRIEFLYNLKWKSHSILFFQQRFFIWNHFRCPTGTLPCLFKYRRLAPRPEGCLTMMYFLSVLLR